jgi:lysophospholipase L1-like esterase
MRSRLFRLVCLAVPTAAAVLFAGPAAATTTPVDYVALGDSYSAGVGAGGYDPLSGICLRSPHSYAPLWARSHQTSSFWFVACGAATVDDVRNFQIWFVNSHTDLVTISAGGNDVGFATTVVTCQLGSDSACLNAIATGRQKAETELPGKLDSAYAAIRQRAPHARVVVMGYPRLLETGSCPGGMSLVKRQALAEGADHLASVISGRARAAGFEYVDMRPVYAGHGICSDTPWINDFLTGGVFESFHPTRTGYASGSLSALRDLIG